MFDTHCHLQLEDYNKNQKDILTQCAKEGISLLVPGINFDSSIQAVELAGQYKFVYAAIGLHPNHTYQSQTPDTSYEYEEYDVNKYKTLVIGKDKYVRAIGEIGLDYYRLPNLENKEAGRQAQQKIFIQQLGLAQELNLPVLVHCRDAHDDMLEILKTKTNHWLGLKGVIHSFTGNLSLAQQYIDLGFVIGVNGILTFLFLKKNALQDLIDVVAKIPLDKLVLETDAPYLAPVPFRGQQNSPLYLKYISQCVADIRGRDVNDVIEATTINARKLLRL